MDWGFAFAASWPFNQEQEAASGENVGERMKGYSMQNVIFLGLVSFFADISSEMVYPLIPLYITSVFGATPVLVGIIEGIAESVAGLLKVFSGYISDRYQRKKPLAFFSGGKRIGEKHHWPKRHPPVRPHAWKDYL